MNLGFWQLLYIAIFFREWGRLAGLISFLELKSTRTVYSIFLSAWSYSYHLTVAWGSHWCLPSMRFCSTWPRPEFMSFGTGLMIEHGEHYHLVKVIPPKIWQIVSADSDSHKKLCFFWLMLWNFTEWLLPCKDDSIAVHIFQSTVLWSSMDVNELYYVVNVVGRRILRLSEWWLTTLSGTRWGEWLEGLFTQALHWQLELCGGKTNVLCSSVNTFRNVKSA